jgi:hypothetical protein
MTDTARTQASIASAMKRLRKRRAADGRFRYYGLSAILTALGALAVLVFTIGSQALSAATYHVVNYDITLDPAVIAPEGAGRPEDISRNVEGFYGLVRDNLIATFPEAAKDRASRREVADFVTRLAVLPLPCAASFSISTLNVAGCAARSTACPRQRGCFAIPPCGPFPFVNSGDRSAYAPGQFRSRLENPSRKEPENDTLGRTKNRHLHAHHQPDHHQP